jgi:hypothetical protein
VCQVLASPFVHLEVSVPLLTWEHQEFSFAISSIQPLLGVSIDPVSRGPPVA